MKLLKKLKQTTLKCNQFHEVKHYWFSRFFRKILWRKIHFIM